MILFVRFSNIFADTKKHTTLKKNYFSKMVLWDLAQQHFPHLETCFRKKLNTRRTEEYLALKQHTSEELEDTVHTKKCEHLAQRVVKQWELFNCRGSLNHSGNIRIADEAEWATRPRHWYLIKQVVDVALQTNWALLSPTPFNNIHLTFVIGHGEKYCTGYS